MIESINAISQQIGIPAWLLGIVLVWSLIWKGIALWKSARGNHSIWFVAFLVIQTMGILEILYIFLFSKIKLDDLKDKKQLKNKSTSNNKLPKSRSLHHK